jgi:hypothetical protein
MQSVYMAVRVRPFPRLPSLEHSGCGPSTLISPASNANASPRFMPCHCSAPPPPHRSQLHQPRPRRPRCRDLQLRQAGLNAAAREASRLPPRAPINSPFSGSSATPHHSTYEVHFKSKYEGEKELKYRVAIYCQQGWDPTNTQPMVTLMSDERRSARPKQPERRTPPIAATTGTLRQSAYTTTQARSQPTKTNRSARLAPPYSRGSDRKQRHAVAVRDCRGVPWRQPGWEL